MPRIGVLALQGDFEAHGKALERAGASAAPVRTAGELEQVDGLVIPGGESTTMLKLLRAENLFEALREFGRRKPVFGTCAGAILMASEVLNPVQECLGLCDLKIERNAYGRQLDSQVAAIQAEEAFTAPGNLEAVFIRAPIIRAVGPDAVVLATFRGDPVLVEQGRHLVATFHPELSEHTAIHERFLRSFGVR